MSGSGKVGVLLLVLGLGFGGVFAYSTLSGIIGLYAAAADPEGGEIDEAAASAGLKRSGLLTLGIGVPLVGAGSALLMRERFLRGSRRRRSAERG